MLDANMYLYFLKIIQPSQEEHFKHQPNIYIGPCPTWSLLCLCPTILTSNSTKPSADTFRHMVCLFLFCFFNLSQFFYCYRFQICFDWSDDFFFKWLRDAAKFLHNWSILAYKWTPRQAINIGSGNGLVPSGNKSLPETMSTKISQRHTTLLTTMFSSNCMKKMDNILSN